MRTNVGRYTEQLASLASLGVILDKLMAVIISNDANKCN